MDEPRVMVTGAACDCGQQFECFRERRYDEARMFPFEERFSTVRGWNYVGGGGELLNHFPWEGSDDCDGATQFHITMEPVDAE